MEDKIAAAKHDMEVKVKRFAELSKAVHSISNNYSSINI